MGSVTAGGPTRGPVDGRRDESYDDAGNQPTDIIQRRPLADQPTTALPRPSGTAPRSAPVQPVQPVQPVSDAVRPVRPAASGLQRPANGGYQQIDDPAFPTGAHYPGYPPPASFSAETSVASSADAIQRASTPRGAHLPPYRESIPAASAASAASAAAAAAGGTAKQRVPRKLTVTRVAAMRSREITLRGVDLFHRAATADGADRSGLTHLTYAQMANYACDAALAVALANSLFLVNPAEGPGRVLLYLLITVAPFALVAPLIGPLLDRLQSGRRLALALSMAGRGVLAIPMIFLFTGDTASWVLYPCALGSLVLSKSFTVLRASLTPRVLPSSITLVATNSRLTVFGLIAGGAAGIVAGLLTWLAGSPGALVFTALLGFGGAYLCMQIPRWVESTEGEVPVHLSHANRNEPAQLTVPVRTTLWANSSIRIETGFLAMFIAFVVMKEYAAESGFFKLLLVGLVGVAAGIGGFVGNALGAKMPLRSPELISLSAVIATLVSTIFAALIPGLAMAAVVGFLGSTASSLAKVCLDSVVQRDLPEVSRASAFGRSETALQLAWVFGGVVGLLIGGLLDLSHDAVYSIGFAAVSALVALGIVQTWLVRGGRSLLPALHWPRRRARSASAPRATRNPDGTYTTRISFTDPAAGPPSPPTTPAPQTPPATPVGPPTAEMPWGARPAAAPRAAWTPPDSPPTAWSDARPAGPASPMQHKAGRRRLRSRRDGVG